MVVSGLEVVRKLFLLKILKEIIFLLKSAQCEYIFYVLWLDVSYI